MKRYAFHAMILASTWMFVRGSISLSTFVSGLVIGLPLAYSFRRFYQGQLKVSALKRLPHLVVYSLSFLKELVVSNLEVAYLVLHPKTPVNPGFIEYKSELEHPTAVAVLANSITLTPGTLTVDHREKDNTLLIHCLKLDDRQEEKQGIEKWEKQLKKVFGEEK